MRLTILFLTILTCILDIPAQTVTVSREISLKNDQFYDILGKVENHVILFRERGNNYHFEVYDTDLSFIKEREITFEKNDVEINGIVSHDSTFNILYSYKDKRYEIHRIRRYDSNLILQDSSELFRLPKTFKRRRMLMETSENKEYSTLFNFEEKNKLNCYVVRHDSLNIPFSKILEVEDIDLQEKFKSISITNRSEIIILLELRNGRYTKDENHLGIFVLDVGPDYFYSKITTIDRVLTDIKMKFDNTNRRISLAGLWNEKNRDEAEGYCYLNKPLITLQPLEMIHAERFTPQFLADATGNEIGKISTLRNYELKEILHREDGGLIMFAEVKKEYTRRSNYAITTDINRGMSGWMDHFLEDIMVIALYPDGRSHWQKILFKKQFSQDDNAIFSSYFLMKTPSRLRLIYNDEIKNNNTVSEYVLNPIGQYNRSSLLSTDYQNLKIRFADGVQISNQEIIAPSEKNRKLTLVKIAY